MTRYKLIIKEGFKVILQGELSSLSGDEWRAGKQNDMDKLMLEMEMAVNANTQIRMHIERVDE